MSLKSGRVNIACRRQGPAGVLVPSGLPAPVLCHSCPVLWCGGWLCGQLLLSCLGQAAYPLWASPSSSEQCANADAHLTDCHGDQVGNSRGCLLTPRKPKVGFSCCHAFFFPPDLSFSISYLTVRLNFPIFLFTPSGKSNPEREFRFCDSCDCTWAPNFADWIAFLAGCEWLVYV